MSGTVRHKERQQRQLQKQSTATTPPKLQSINTINDQAYQSLSTDILSQQTAPDINNPKYIEQFIQSIIYKQNTAHSNIQSKLSYRTIQLDNTAENSIQRKKRKRSNETTQRQVVCKQLKTLSNKQCKQLGLYNIDKNVSTKYSDYITMNELWTQYATDVLCSKQIKQYNNNQQQNKSNKTKQHNNQATTAPSTTDTITPTKQHTLKIDSNKLLTLDFNGCMMTVVRSTNPAQIGITGICINETQHMFKFITTNDKLKSIQKHNSVFECNILQHKYLLYGAQFVCRSIERSVKKWKHKPTIEM